MSLDGLDLLRPDGNQKETGTPLTVRDLADTRAALDREYRRFAKWQRVKDLPDVRSRWRRFWDRGTDSAGAR